MHAKWCSNYWETVLINFFSFFSSGGFIHFSKLCFLSSGHPHFSHVRKANLFRVGELFDHWLHSERPSLVFHSLGSSLHTLFSSKVGVNRINHYYASTLFPLVQKRPELSMNVKRAKANVSTFESCCFGDVNLFPTLTMLRFESPYFGL